MGNKNAKPFRGREFGAELTSYTNNNNFIFKVLDI